jgi:hypothetical protein
MLAQDERRLGHGVRATKDYGVRGPAKGPRSPGVLVTVGCVPAADQRQSTLSTSSWVAGRMAGMSGRSLVLDSIVAGGY